MIEEKNDTQLTSIFLTGFGWRFEWETRYHPAGMRAKTTVHAADEGEFGCVHEVMIPLFQGPLSKKKHIAFNLKPRGTNIRPLSLGF